METRIGLTDCSRDSRRVSSPSHNSDSIWILLTILRSLSCLDEIRATKKTVIWDHCKQNCDNHRPFPTTSTVSTPFLTLLGLITRVRQPHFTRDKNSQLTAACVAANIPVYEGHSQMPSFNSPYRNYSASYKKVGFSRIQIVFCHNLQRRARHKCLFSDKGICSFSHSTSQKHKQGYQTTRWPNNLVTWNLPIFQTWSKTTLNTWNISNVSSYFIKQNKNNSNKKINLSSETKNLKYTVS